MIEEERVEPHRPPNEAESSRSLFGRTWELELLISGGVVFTLLQLPPLLDRAFLRLESNLGGWGREAGALGHMYLGAILYTLIIAFLLHLAARAYWIGLIGLETVYPRGVRWEHLKYGPITIRRLREQVPALPSLIVRVDLFCSSIFSLAFLVVLACLMSIVWIAVCCGIAWVLARMFGEESISRFFWAVLIMFCAVLVFPALLDRLLGHRLDPGSRTARFIEGWMRFTDRLQMGALFTPIAVTLFSNQRRRWFYNLVAAGFFALMIVVSVGYAVRREGISLLGRAPESVAPERQIHAVHYEDQWPEEGAFQLAPSIQSDVIEGPYLELFLPYRPDRHDPVFARQCPHQPRAILECAARVHRVSLDGKPVRELTFHFYEHPRTGVRGFRAYIPVRGIAPGGHLLRIEPLPREARLLRKKAEPWLIRFWT